jgi:hypothetical protein
MWAARWRRTATLKDLLNHLYVLIPVLDDEKQGAVFERCIYDPVFGHAPCSS